MKDRERVGGREREREGERAREGERERDREREREKERERAHPGYSGRVQQLGPYPAQVALQPLRPPPLPRQLRLALLEPELGRDIYIKDCRLYYIKLYTPSAPPRASPRAFCF